MYTRNGCTDCPVGNHCEANAFVLALINKTCAPDEIIDTLRLASGSVRGGVSIGRSMIRCAALSQSPRRFLWRDTSPTLYGGVPSFQRRSDRAFRAARQPQASRRRQPRVGRPHASIPPPAIRCLQIGYQGLARVHNGLAARCAKVHYARIDWTRSIRKCPLLSTLQHPQTPADETNHTVESHRDSVPPKAAMLPAPPKPHERHQAG